MPMWTGRQLLTSYNNGKGGVVSVLAETSIGVTFDERGDLGGLAGCNSFWGAYTTDGDTLSISSLDSTNLSCTEPAGIMEQEAAYLSALRDAATFRYQGGRARAESGGRGSRRLVRSLESTSRRAVSWWFPATDLAVGGLGRVKCCNL